MNIDTCINRIDKIRSFISKQFIFKKSILVKAYIYFLKKDYEKTRAIS